MGKTTNPDPPNYRKYGVPLFGVAWVPFKTIKFENQDQDQGQEEEDRNQSNHEAPADPNYILFAGGGGEGRSGIPNAVLLAQFDSNSNSLSELPVVKHGTGSEAPYRMAVHPGGDGLICAMPNSCRLFEWDAVKSIAAHRLSIKSSEKVLSQLEEVGQQLALTFNVEGSVLAVGGEDGYLRVFKWPSMEIIINEAQGRGGVKDLNFSPDGKFLLSLESRGPCRVWDMNSSAVVASLQKENDEVFGFCRFSQINDKNQFLYTAATTGRGGSIVTWNTTSWKRMGNKRIVRDAISAFNISPNGKLLGIGTTEGDILILNSASLSVQAMVRKAHLGMVTTLAFSRDSSALASVSMDSSARVTKIEYKKKNGLSLWIIVFILLLAIAAYFLNKGAFLE